MNKVLISSSGVSVVVVLIGIFLLSTGRESYAGLYDFVVIGIALFLIPAGTVDFLKRRRIREIESMMPDFLRDIAEYSRFGMTLADSIISASKGRYGILTDEIKKMAYQIQWGISVTAVLQNFLKRYSTPLTRRVIGAVIKSNEAGGNLSEVIAMIANYARETQQLNKEKYSQLSSYTVILLITYGVFLLTVVVLNVQFFPQMLKSGGGSVISTSLPLINVEIIPQIKLIFAGIVLIYGVGNGLMAGVLRDGRFESGFLIAGILPLAGYLVLLVLGGV